jgi:hypothetical protein
MVGRQQAAQTAKCVEQCLRTRQRARAALGSEQQCQHFGIGEVRAVLRPWAAAAAVGCARGGPVGSAGCVSRAGHVIRAKGCIHGSEHLPHERGIASAKLRRIPP